MLNYFLGTFIILVFGGIFIHFVPTKRKKTIQEIISDLELLRSNQKYKKAAEINITFLKSARSVFGYFRWLITVMPKLRQERENILELADLPLPKWQKETHLRLINLERLAFPGLLKPVKKTVLQEIFQWGKIKKGPIILLSIGSGGMELERQIIKELLNRNFQLPIIFLCVEKSPYISKIGLLNLKKSFLGEGIKIKKIPRLDNRVLTELEQEVFKKEKKILITLLNIDIFNLKGILAPNSIDLVYHSRLKHHLSPVEKENLDKIETYISPKIIEFDDIFSVPVFIFPSIITWRWPVTLNGAILSYIRDYSKRELLSQSKKSWKIKIYNTLGYYLRVYGEDKSNI